MCDEDLMRAYQAGDVGAFEELFRRFRGKVMAYVCARGLSQGQAEEVVQEIFMKMHRLRQRYDPAHSVASWIFTITRTVFIDYLRKSERWTRNAASDAECLHPHERSNMTLPSMGSLSAEEQQLITERYLQEQGYEEIAAAHNISAASARKRVSRALAKWREQLREDDL